MSDAIKPGTIVTDYGSTGSVFDILRNTDVGVVKSVDEDEGVAHVFWVHDQAVYKEPLSRLMPHHTATKLASQPAESPLRVLHEIVEAWEDYLERRPRHPTSSDPAIVSAIQEARTILKRKEPNT